MSKKILFASSSFGGGGITSYAHESIDCLCADNDIYVLIGDDSKDKIDEGKATVLYCDMDDLSIKNAKHVLYLINEKIKPDVLINSNASVISLVTPYIANVIKVISVSHNFNNIESDVASLNSKYIDNIIALSSAVRNYLIRKIKPEDSGKISIVHNFLPSDSGVRNKLDSKINRKRLKIVYAGGMPARKSPEIITGILKRLLRSNLDFSFFFLGNNTLPHRSIYGKSSLKEFFPEDPRLIFTERVPREKALEIISDANIFLIPSKREGCSIAMLEAMRFGCISITSDYENACKEIIRDGVDGFIIPHRNVDIFVHRIEHIIQNHPQYSDFYYRCIEKFEDNFSCGRWRRKMADILDDEHPWHSPRIDSFSRWRFIRSRMYLQYRKRYGTIYSFIFEKMKVALVFFLEKV